jgi:hypothetical protein
MTKREAPNEIKYSRKIPGDKGNWDWPAQFDISSDGYLGISQDKPDGEGACFSRLSKLRHSSNF